MAADLLDDTAASADDTPGRASSLQPAGATGDGGAGDQLDLDRPPAEPTGAGGGAKRTMRRWARAAANRRQTPRQPLDLRAALRIPAVQVPMPIGPAGRGPRAPHRQGQPLVYGSACSGIDTPAMATAAATHRIVEHLMAAEPLAYARDFLRRNFSPAHLLSYVEYLPTAAERMDVFAACPPCQPFAPGGAGRGEADGRALAYVQTIRFVTRAVPITFLLENSAWLVTLRGRRLVAWTYRELHGAGYRVVRHRILNTLVQGGIPHFRRRFVLVAIHQDAPGDPAAFEFPGDIPPVRAESLVAKVPVGDEAVKLAARRPESLQAALFVDRAWAAARGMTAGEREQLGAVWFTATHHSATR